MPTPVTIQPITMAPGEAPLDMSDGRLKTPPPIIEPTTSAISGRRVSLCSGFAAEVSDVLVMACDPSGFHSLGGARGADQNVSAVPMPISRAS
jgi:hypothetical protein